MPTSPLISVIVPVYNVAPFLRRCLDSIINQIYKNIEIVLVNDGSTDNSGEILNEYKLKDPRIKIIQQRNGGLSNARNTGISNSKGTYITFIDSDDYVSKDYVSYLLSLLQKNNFQSKLAICSLMNIFTKTKTQKDNGNGQEVVLTGKECIEKMCYQDLVDTCAYAKLGARELYDNVKFPEGMLFEDIATTYKLFDLCDTVCCGFQAKYFYVIREGSIVTSNFSTKKLELLPMTDKMASYVSSKYPELAPATLRRQVYSRFSTLNQILADSNANVPSQKKAILNYLKLHKKDVLSNPKTPKRDRVAYFFLSFGIFVYKYAWKFYEFLKTTKILNKES
ncbi:glycosyltransferase family 2 protein [Liquorilactobacillus hordei]|uniref:glycosyltransferase family 2 protein n=1 Tax=Liquorilactobacillus hordei TaxID=468911 RepID=UPI001CBB4D5C|nr:glycosyltransferase family 2 protein [Liquorilactobacillus hordei]MBZ2404815.1 glycosyl transferase family 2 [Liquorilactobacillus hordei]